ncbi:hypothetical protein J3Q64DRAFT_1709887 [Phycomyces blakesleeanus]|uniref:Uncharacterized protein n=1 Tax=Phycomyces blakesleeanus TaxID=4837 RepID=A0ABR3BDD5_PHYBL
MHSRTIQATVLFHSTETKEVKSNYKPSIIFHIIFIPFTVLERTGFATSLSHLPILSLSLYLSIYLSLPLYLNRFALPSSYSFSFRRVLEFHPPPLSLSLYFCIFTR